MSVFDSFKKIEDIGTVKTPRKEPAASEASNTQYYKPEEKKEETKAVDTSAQSAITPASTTPPIAPKMDKERAKKSGQANAYIAAGSLELLFSAIEMVRHSTSMSHEEKVKLISSRQKEADKWTQEEKNINDKFLRLSQKHQKIVDSIASTPQQIDNLTYGFSLYAEITGKETNPAVIIGGALMRYAGEKILQMI